jgi:4'-phosphopantetheinyl transferase EntD
MATKDSAAGQADIWPLIRWLDDDTVLILDRIGTLRRELVGGEREQVSTMTEGRRREFAAGRVLARQASALLGESSNHEIPMGEGGEPLWPLGIVGSLSHTATHVAALVTRAARHASVGIDLDDGRLLGATAASDLMTDSEVEAVRAHGWTDDPEIARNLAFLAKEALFKYQYPNTGFRELGFDEVRLHRTVAGLRASTHIEGERLRAVIAEASLFYEEIQSLRVCWVISRSP